MNQLIYTPVFKHITQLAGWALIGVYTYIAFFYIRSSPVWNPADELPHLDYIDRIAYEQRVPKDGEWISDRSFQFHLDLRVVNAPGFDSTKTNLYPISISYEAHQPPLYYMIMALPYKWIMQTKRSPREKIFLLRLISYALHLVGIFLIPFIFFEWNKINATQKINPAYPFLAMSLVMIATLNNRAGINNDQASLLFVNASIFFLIRFLRTQSVHHLTLAIAIACLSFWIKFTNGLFLILLVSIIPLILHRTRQKSPLIRVSYFFPLVLIPAYLAWMISIHGIENPWNQKYTQHMFSIFQPGLLSIPAFLKLQWMELFSLHYLMIFHQYHLSIGYLLFAGSLLILLIHFVFNRKIHRIWLLSWILVAILYAILIFLNRSVCCVAWFSIRLISGYMLFVVIAITGFLAPDNKLNRILTFILLFICFIPAVSYLATW